MDYQWGKKKGKIFTGKKKGNFNLQDP